jgi:hypothetical protein
LNTSLLKMLPEWQKKQIVVIMSIFRQLWCSSA